MNHDLEDPLVAVTELTVRMPSRSEAVLDGISFSLRRGELVALLGRNGSGKTSLLRTLAGLLAPTHGRVCLCGEEPTRLRPRERARRIALVPQGLEHLTPQSVSSFVRGGRYAHFGQADARTDRESCERAMIATGIAELASRDLVTLSGGERQRALVARALAQDTPILLGDEPTASLDPEQQIAILELFATAARSGRAVMVVTHDLNLASQFADKIALLDRGRLVAWDRPSVVLTEATMQPVFGSSLRILSDASLVRSPIVFPVRPDPHPR
ncbi:MAG: ABC transporter ATP-binding protein [Planctomycetota bacterium]